MTESIAKSVSHDGFYKIGSDGQRYALDASHVHDMPENGALVRYNYSVVSGFFRNLTLMPSVSGTGERHVIVRTAVDSFYRFDMRGNPVPNTGESHAWGVDLPLGRETYAVVPVLSDFVRNAIAGRV